MAALTSDDLKSYVANGESLCPAGAVMLNFEHNLMKNNRFFEIPCQLDWDVAKLKVSAAPLSRQLLLSLHCHLSSSPTCYLYSIPLSILHSFFIHSSFVLLGSRVHNDGLAACGR
jgi:hypothetical protein